MDLRPLNEIDLRCTSVAEHLGFVALADIAKVMGDHDGRIIGGHMVSLHVYRWGLDLFRATQDADLGVRPAVVRTPELTDRLIAIGYRKTAGNRFEKPVENLSSHTDAVRPGAAIDILVPSYTTRARRNRRFGSHLATTEVPGLAGAMQRPAIDVTVNATLLDNTTATIIVRLPDEVGALILKVMARSVRDEDRDALDVWRALEVCAAAKLRPADFGTDDRVVRQILADQFGRGGKGISDIIAAANLGPSAAQGLETRIQALKARVTGDR